MVPTCYTGTPNGCSALNLPLLCFLPFLPKGTRTVQVRIVVAGTGGSKQVDGVKRLTGMISSFRFQIQLDIGTQ